MTCMYPKNSCLAHWAGEMAECARQLVLEPYVVLLNDVRSSSRYVWSLKIFFNSFSALINQLPTRFVLFIIVRKMFDIIDIGVLCV